MIWTSPLGGRRTEGGAISRFFTIAPGIKSELVLSAYEYPARVSQTGAFVMEKGSRPTTVIRLPAKYADMEMVAYKWHYLENDYMSQKYCIDNMKEVKSWTGDKRQICE